MDVFKVIGFYLLAVNLLGFVLMGADKAKARKRAWRIPEMTLFLVAFIGGAVGSILGMQVFRHKTQHKSFTVGMPLILVLHILIGLFLWKGPVNISIL